MGRQHQKVHVLQFPFMVTEVVFHINDLLSQPSIQVYIKVKVSRATIKQLCTLSRCTANYYINNALLRMGTTKQ